MKNNSTNLKQDKLTSMPEKKGWTKFIVYLCVLGVLFSLVLASVFAGFKVYKNQIFPFELLNKVDRKLEQLVFSRLKNYEETETALIQIIQNKGLVSDGPLDLVLQWGGALTSFGDDVLILPYKGTLFAASSPETIRKTNIKAPNNNRNEYKKAYKALSENSAFGKTETRGIDYLRYNDILYYKNSEAHGLVISYTEYHTKDQCVTNTLAKVQIDPEIKSVDDLHIVPEDWTVFFRTKPCLPFKPKGVAMEGHMAGGRMVFNPPSTIYLTSGDFGFDSVRSDTTPYAQNPQVEYGKILLVDLNTGDKRIISSGLRNMQGIAQTLEGNIYVVDHGARGGDELNWIKEGNNYGWPVDGYGTLYSGQSLPGATALGRHDRFVKPILAWLPSIAVSGLAVVNGFHEAWEGDLLVATMADQSLHRVRVLGNKAAYSERIYIGSRIRYVHQHNDGRIVLWTDNHELIFLKGENLKDSTKLLESYFETVNLSAASKQKLTVAIQGCSECHSFSPGQHARSPGLNNIYNNLIGSSNYKGYSNALKQKSGRWSEENLVLFLCDPQAFAPGSMMPAQAKNDLTLAREIVAYLKHLDSQR